jgi:hypothetical protein
MNAVDFQSMFNLAIAVVGALFGWLLKSLQDQIKEAKDAAADAKDAAFQEVKELRTRQDTFALKDDVKDGFNRLETNLNRIFHLLERKVDKA